MLSVVGQFTQLTVGEEKLRDAVRSGEPCDLPGDWGADSQVRAGMLKAILSGDGAAWGINARAAAVNLSGAVITGDLKGFDGSRLPPMQLEGCKFGGVDFCGATFTGDTSFKKSIFTGDTSFKKAAFTGETAFHTATFITAPWFIDTTFMGDAWFIGATFCDGAAFSRATFISEARFGETVFGKVAQFYGTNFTRDASFNKGGFSGRAGFDRASFTGKAVFDGVTFAGKTSFLEAKFTGHASFRHALARELIFTRAVFATPDPGPWLASTVSLEQATLAAPSRVSITATEIDASRLQAPQGAQLALSCPKVNLSGSELSCRSLVSTPPLAVEIPVRNAPEQLGTGSPRTDAQALVAKAGNELREELISKFAAWKVSWSDINAAVRLCDQQEAIRRAYEAVRETPRSGVVSLSRANVSELALSDVVLDDCEFVGALGLDKLRIGPGCMFRRTPRSWGRRRMGRRRIIVEELRWRQAHTGRAEAAKVSCLSALDIAEIYRDLRKGLEEAKNEPGAADFYYGEMEMRRLVGRKPTGSPAATRRRASSWAERALLNVYWAFSGYGLRASRALATFAVMIAAAACLYTHPFFATTPRLPQIAAIDLKTGAVSHHKACQSTMSADSPTTGATSEGPCPAVKFWPALDYAARESISLLQIRSTATLDTTPAGTLLDFFLRLAGPALLAFTILALRARIKR